MRKNQYTSTLIKRWWLIPLLVAAGAIIGNQLSHTEDATYLASTTLLVGQSSIQAVNVNPSDEAISRNLAQTYANWTRRQPVLQKVVERLNLLTSWQTLKEQVQARPVNGTQFLEIIVEADSEAQARSIADEIAHQLIDISPTALQNKQQSENRILIQQQIEELQVRIQQGKDQLAVLRAKASGALSTDEIDKLSLDINNLEMLIIDWEANYTQLLIFAESAEKPPNYLSIIEAAQTSIRPVQRSQYAFIGALIGLLLAAAAALAWESLDTTVKTVEELNQLPVIRSVGGVHRIPGEGYHNQLILAQDSFSPVTEAYRKLRTQIQSLASQQPMKTLVLTSAAIGEGKSITAANLAIITAQAGLKTVIVDADMRRPTQHQIFNTKNRGGLSDLLRSRELDPEATIQKTSVENLWLLPSGTIPRNPAELLGSRRMDQVLLRLRQKADVIICDSPPVLPVADAAILATKSDHVLLLVEAGRSSKTVVIKAIESLQEVGTNTVSGIINGVNDYAQETAYYGYGPESHQLAQKPSSPVAQHISLR